MDAIRLINMQFYAHHGVLSAEADSGQRFEVDLEVKGDWKKAGISDNIDDTVNYETLFKIVSDIVMGKLYKLIEALAEEICRQISAQITSVKYVRVCIRKPSASLKGILDYVEVEIERQGEGE